MKNSFLITLWSCFYFANVYGQVGVGPIVRINPKTEVPNPYWGFNELHGNGMIGWTFQLLVPFAITQVGWYDEDPTNGLSRAIQVGLWQGNGSNAHPGVPWNLTAWSLIGDPTNGLAIPSGTNASLQGNWRVLDLSNPLILQPGFYELGGLDTAATSDIIKYVVAGNPGISSLTPPGSPLVIGPLFYAAFPWTSQTTNLLPTTNYELIYGLELGPMLFGTNAPTTGSRLSIRVLTLNDAQGKSGPGVLLIWPTGTLQQADVANGPYNAVVNAASPMIIPLKLSAQKFYRVKL